MDKKCFSCGKYHKEDEMSTYEDNMPEKDSSYKRIYYCMKCMREFRDQIYRERF